MLNSIAKECGNQRVNVKVDTKICGEKNTKYVRDGNAIMQTYKAYAYFNRQSCKFSMLPTANFKCQLYKISTS